MPSRSQTRRNLQNEIAASLQISAAGGGLAEISMDRSQKVGVQNSIAVGYRAEFYRHDQKTQGQIP